MEVTVHVDGALQGAAGAAFGSLGGAAHAFGVGGLAVLAAIGVAPLLGDFYVKYCMVKAGVYVPTAGALGPAR